RNGSFCDRKRAHMSSQGLTRAHCFCNPREIELFSGIASEPFVDLIPAHSSLLPSGELKNSPAKDSSETAILSHYRNLRARNRSVDRRYGHHLGRKYTQNRLFW